MRKLVARVGGITAVLMLGLVVGSALAGSAGRRWEASPNRQAILTRVEPVTTESSSFEDIPGLSDEVIKNRGAYVITFSGEFTGGPVEIRVAGARPGPVLFGETSAGNASETGAHSFSFADRVGREGTCSTIDVEWRSVDGTQVTLEEGSVVVDYRYVGDRRARQIGCV